jgi:hypothetical protein
MVCITFKFDGKLYYVDDQTGDIYEVTIKDKVTDVDVIRAALKTVVNQRGR